MSDEVAHLRICNAELEQSLSHLQAKVNQPAKDSSNSSRPPSTDQKENKTSPKPGGPRKASVGREGGERPLHPNPNQQIHARAKTCPHCGHEVREEDRHLHAVYDKIEIQPVEPIITRVHQYGGHCLHCDAFL